MIEYKDIGLNDLVDFMKPVSFDEWKEYTELNPTKKSGGTCSGSVAFVIPSKGRIYSIKETKNRYLYLNEFSTYEFSVIEKLSPITEGESIDDCIQVCRVSSIIGIIKKGNNG